MKAMMLDDYVSSEGLEAQATTTILDDCGIRKANNTEGTVSVDDCKQRKTISAIFLLGRKGR